MSRRRGRPLGHAIEPGLGDIEDAAEALHRDQRLGGLDRYVRCGRGHAHSAAAVTGKGW